MNKYQIVILRKLKGFGQFVTESRDEVNTYQFGEGDERPVIFGEKLKAVERRTVMRKVREVLKVTCYLQTSKKRSDSGISGLCMSCPACALFGGTYAPKKGGSAGDAPRNAIEMRRVYYTAAFPFTGGGIRDVTFNAVDERTGQTGRALGTNQIIEPRDFIDVVTVEADDEKWAKLLIWGVEHSDRYGANTRIYGEIHNEVLGAVVDTRLRIAALDLARLQSGDQVQQFLRLQPTDMGWAGAPKRTDSPLGTPDLTVAHLACGDDEIDQLIKELAKSEIVEDLARRKNSVDVAVEEYFKNTAGLLEATLPTEKKANKEVWKTWSGAERLEFLAGACNGKASQFDLARKIEEANFAEPSEGDEEEDDQ